MTWLPKITSKRDLYLVYIQLIDSKPLFNIINIEQQGDTINFNHITKVQKLTPECFPNSRAQQIICVERALFLHRISKLPFVLENANASLPGLDPLNFHIQSIPKSDGTYSIYLIQRSTLSKLLEGWPFKTQIQNFFFGFDQAFSMLENESILAISNLEKFESPIVRELEQISHVKSFLYPVAAHLAGERGLDNEILFNNVRNYKLKNRSRNLLFKVSLPLLLLIALFRFYNYQNKDLIKNQLTEIRQLKTVINNSQSELSKVAFKEYGYFPLSNLVDSIAFLTPKTINLIKLTANPVTKIDRRNNQKITDPSKVLIAGVTNEQGSILDYIIQLNKIKRLDSIQIISINERRKSQVLEFNIESRIKHEL